jgi:beta-lactamase regulating signal transducer with metallopeptidase domain
VNDLGTVLVVLAAQVTLPVLGGLLLSRRRDPAAACGPMVLAAVAVLLLTPLAFMPKPDWPTTSRPASETHVGTPAEEMPSANQAPGGIDLLQLARVMKPNQSAVVEPEAPTVDQWRVVALVGLVAAGLGVARLAVGFLFVFMTLRRSLPVTDPGLIATADELRATLACRRPVRLRESFRVGSAATTGWLRPVVLLSPMWRTWSPTERRAVLAHELAHVARGDFVGRLAARLAVAFHGYHPLVRWLAARLELRQEMAADARAASACDGRPAYLKCLAGLALKADARPFGPVPTFLSGPRTLFRRIAMLRVTDDTASRRRRWPAFAVALLAAAALGLHGSKPQAVAGPVVPAKFVEAKEKPPLDASFVVPTGHPDEVGVFAVRLGELLRTPGLEKTVGSYSEFLAAAFDGKKPLFDLADIEQISGRVTLGRHPKQPTPNRSLMLSLGMVRMSKDFDWAKQLQAWTTDWKEHAYGGSKMYSAKLTIPLLGFVDQTAWFYMPDGRTVVLESEENIKKLIDARGKPAAPAWADDWKTVENGTFAMVIPDVKGKLAKSVPTGEAEDEVSAQVCKAVAVVAGKASRASVGIEVGTGCSITVRLACASATDAADVDVGCQALAKLAEAAVAGPEPTDPLEKAGHKFSAMLVRGVEFGKTVDHVVEIRMKAEGGLTDLLKAVGSK